MGCVEISVLAKETDRLAIARALDAAPSEWSIEFSSGGCPPSGLCVAAADALDAPVDAIRFDPQRPNELVPAIANRLRARSPRVVIVTGASRGCGVTTVALHLAGVIASRCRTCFVDLDRSWGARDRLGLPENALTWGSGDLENALLPVAGGFRALISPGDNSPPPPDLVQGLVSRFESVVVDAPDHVQETEPVRAAVLVVSPTDEGARRARRMLAESPDLPWVCVSNRLGPGGETTRSELERVMGRRFALELPCTPALRDVEGERLLRSVSHRWVRRLDALGEGILR
jgi:hypothetical protein